MFKLDATKLVDDRPFPGNSSASTVYAYRQDAFDKRFVAKHIACKDINHLMFALQEIAIGYNCDHPAIVPVRAFSVEPTKTKGWSVYIKMARMEESFREMIENHKSKTMRNIEKENIVHYFHTIACGLEYLHNKRIPHRNLKPSNIMISWEGQIKLAGAGSSPFVLDGKEESPYLAPEMCFPIKGTKKKELCQSDMWSFGLVMAEICLLRSKSITNLLSAEDKGPALRQVIEEIRDKYDVGLANILADMMCFNPKKRKTAKDVIKELEDKYGDILMNYGSNKKRTEENERTNGLPKEEVNVSPSKGFREKKTIQTRKSLYEKKEEDNLEQLVLEKRHVSAPGNSAPNWPIFFRDIQERWSDRFELDSEKPMFLRAVRKVGVDDGVLAAFSSNLADKMKMYDVDTLRGIELNLTGCEKVTDQSLNQLSTTLGYSLNRLEQLSLQFSPWDFSNKITDSALKNLSSEIGKKLTDLKQLSLSFSLYDSITDKGLSDLSLNLCEKLQNLQRLKLELSESRSITDLGVERLASHISQFQRNLKHLTLNLYDCPKVTEDAINYFISTVTKSVKGLESLGLDLSRSRISDGEIGLLATCMGQYLRGLTALNLKVEGCSRISDQGVMNLATEFGRTVDNLQELHLNFYDCRKISDDGVSYLANKIGQNLRNVRRLTLDFSRSLVTDESIKQIATQVVQNLRNLEQLNLNFYWCGSITNEGVNHLAKSIHRNLQYIQQLKLNLLDCWEVSDDTKDSMRRVLSFIPKLTIE